MSRMNERSKPVKLYLEEMAELMVAIERRRPKPDLLTRGQAADYLVARGAENYTSKALANLASRGSGPPYIKLGNQVYYTEQDLETWILKQRIVPAGYYHLKGGAA